MGEITFARHVSKMVHLGISKKRIQNYINKGYSDLTIDLNYQEVHISEKTKYHYNQLNKILSDKGIKYIAMQYPRKNVSELKNYFNGDEDIIFVSNEKNFEKALEKRDYDYYFTDSFRGTGHTTVLGNRLIAENVANIILNDAVPK